MTNGRHIELFLAFLLLAGVGSVPGVAGAQQPEQRAERQTRTTPAIRESIYQELSKAQMAAEEERYQEAIGVLDQLRSDATLNSYERAQVWNIYAYIHIAQEEYQRAIEAYERLLSQENLPLGLETSTRYSLAQLYFTTERYEQAAETLERWFEFAENPASSAYILLANAYYSLGEYQRALGPAQRALEEAQNKGEPIQEHWWQLLRAVHFELGNYERVAEILEILVERFPRKDYWLQLSSIYGELEQYDKQARVLDIAYQQRLLTRESELINYAQVLMQQEIPYRAARVIEKGFEQGVIERNVRHLRLLAQAYRLAKEDKAALEPLQAAAEMSEDGELYMQLAYAYSNLRRWSDAAEAAKRALTAGGLRQRGQAQLFRGTALYNADRLEAAKEAFQAAANDESTASQARQWIQYVNKEMDRRERLAEVM